MKPAAGANRTVPDLEQPSAHTDRIDAPEASSGRVTDHPEPLEAASDGSVEWSVWPLKESLLRSLAVILFLAAIVWTLDTWFGPQWILPSAFILILFLSGFFLPTFYRLDAEQVSIRGLITRKKRHWKDFKRCYPVKKGVHLSPTERPSRLENIRGLYLPFGPDVSGERRRQVMAFIEGKLDHERPTHRAAGTAAGEAGP
jgi:hypothetical protein